MTYWFVLLLALLPLAAGAQAPAQLLDRYVETEDQNLLETVGKLLDAMPSTYESRVLRARLALLRGDARSAFDQATELNRITPDDLDIYALMVDAARALGMSEAAERAAQWMLNLRPDDVRSMLKTAAVRQDLGDLTGAEDMLVGAFRGTNRAEIGLRAEILTSLAGVSLRRGEKGSARKLAGDAARLIPRYAPALKLLKEVQ